MTHSKSFQGFKMFLLMRVIHILISEGTEKIFLAIGIFLSLLVLWIILFFGRKALAL